jgi:hypothetical protein
MVCPVCFKLYQTNTFNSFSNTQSGLAPMMFGGSDSYFVTDATSGTVVTSTSDTDNDVTPQGMALKNRNLATGHRYPHRGPKQQLIHGTAV